MDYMEDLFQGSMVYKSEGGLCFQDNGILAAKLRVHYSTLALCSKGAETVTLLDSGL